MKLDEINSKNCPFLFVFLIFFNVAYLYFCCRGIIANHPFSQCRAFPNFLDQWSVVPSAFRWISLRFFHCYCLSLSAWSLTCFPLSTHSAVFASVLPVLPPSVSLLQFFICVHCPSRNRSFYLVRYFSYVSGSLLSWFIHAQHLHWTWPAR